MYHLLLFSAYTQIISLSVYSYLYSHLFGRQFLEPNPDDMEITPDDEFRHLKPSELETFLSPNWHLAISQVLLNETFPTGIKGHW